jgi:hypothetical protein
MRFSRVPFGQTEDGEGTRATSRRSGSINEEQAQRDEYACPSVPMIRIHFPFSLTALNYAF